jgi:outer membrane receptor protein involved in Fe transport
MGGAVRSILAGSALTTFGALLLTSQALAGGAPAPAAASVAPAEAGAAQPAPSTNAGPAEAPRADEGTIVVTGSRLARRAIESIAPVQSFDSKYLDTRGFTTVAQALNELPSFGVPGASPAGFGQSSFGAGQSFVDFLGLGSQRTLVLVNGRRFVSGNTGSIFGPTGSGGGQVDLNTIPTKLIDRVETVVAIGAPIYGSDAVAGTVNILLKRDFKGVDLDAQYDTTDKGDSRGFRVRALAGVNFGGGRGNITLSGEYQQTDGFLRTDRPQLFADNRYGNAPVRGASFAQVRYNDYRVPSVDPFGIPLVTDFFVTSPQQSTAFGIPGLTAGITNGSGQTLRFDRAGNLIPIDFGGVIGRPSGFSVFTSGGNGFSLSQVENLYTDIQRYNGNAIINFELTPKIRLFSEVWYSHSTGRNLANQPNYNAALFDAAGTANGNFILQLSNPFLSAAARSAIQNAIATNPLADSATQNYFYLTRANTDLTPGVSTGAVDLFRIVGGANGEISVLKDRSWKWEISGNFGEAITNSYNQELAYKNVFNALNAVPGPNGTIVCAPGATNSTAVTLSSVCSPINPFGSNITQAARNYVTAIARPRNRNEQVDFVASISGPLFRLPGGDASFALGYEHREETSRFDPGAFYRGERQTDGSFVSYGQNVPILPVRGRFVTNELFGEFNMDLIGPGNDIPFVRSLSLQSAARHIWNSVAGGDLTWTAGVNYGPTKFLNFKGSYTRAVRAPSVTEAFNPRSQSFIFATDPCDSVQIATGPNPAARARNCQAAGVPAGYTSLSDQRSFPGITFGNPNLQNERSDAFIGGVTLTPAIAPGFQLEVDYVDITLNSAISQFSPNQVLSACYDSTNFAGNPFCTLINRGPDSQLTLVQTSYFNSATLSYRGILANLRYRHASPLLGSRSNVTLAFSYQYLDNLSTIVTAGSAPNITDNSTGYSRHKGVLTLGYDNGPLFFQTQVQYIGSAQIDPNAAPNFYANNTIGETAYVNMSVVYTGS